MAVQDFTTYTEVDTLSKLTVLAQSIVWNTVHDEESAPVAVYKDFGVNYFGDDFVHEVTVDAHNFVDGGGDIAIWGVSNTPARSWRNWESGVVLIMTSATTNRRFALHRYPWGGGSNAVVGAQTNFTGNPKYYPRITRSGKTITADIYTNSIRTTLYESISIDIDQELMTGTAFASSSQGSDTPNKAFDSDSFSLWTSSTGGSLPQYIGLDQGATGSIKFTGASLHGVITDGNSLAIDYAFQGSNAGQSTGFTDLLTVTGNQLSGALQSFGIWSNTASYRYNRLNITKTSGTNLYAKLRTFRIRGYGSYRYLYPFASGLDNTVQSANFSSGTIGPLSIFASRPSSQTIIFI